MDIDLRTAALVYLALGIYFARVAIDDAAAGRPYRQGDGLTPGSRFTNRLLLWPKYLGDASAPTPPVPPT